MRHTAATILLLLIIQEVRAQQSPASVEFFSQLSECSGSLGGWKCLDLDLTSEASGEYDSAKIYHYSWNFGDGNRMTGSKVSHCFDAFGTYQVSMDLVDTETDAVIRNELSSTVDLYPEIVPYVISSQEKNRPSFYGFQCEYNQREVFQPDNVYWRIDGKHYEGPSVAHAFHKAGVYVIEMGIEKNSALTGLMKACASTEITIDASEVWTAEINDYFQSTRDSALSGPYVMTDVFCLIIDENKAASFSVLPLHSLIAEAQLMENTRYSIQLFSGNTFTTTKSLNTNGLKGNDLYTALKDSITAYLQEPLIFFPSLAFEKDNLIPGAEDQLKEIKDLIQGHPYFKIEIGSYTHTGSKAERGIQSSISRSSRIKESLVNYGVSPERVIIVSPESNSALMNTCSALPECDREDKRLNGRVELKISGIKL